MAVSDFMAPGIGPRRACKISKVDPANRVIEASLKDATTVQIAVFDSPGLFIWPKEGEYWTIHQREGFWMLDHRAESYDDEQKIADLNPGEGRIDSDVIKTISGKDFVTVNTKDITEGASLVYSKDGWTTGSISDSLTGGADSGKSIPLIDIGSIQLRDDLLIKYKGDAWVPTSTIKVDSIEVTGSKLDNSFTYNTGTVAINSFNTSIVTGTGTTFSEDMVGGTITLPISGTPTIFTITGFDSSTQLRIANASGSTTTTIDYVINYGAQFATSVKIDDNASITVGKSSTSTFGSFNTLTFNDSSLIQLNDSQSNPTADSYQATTGNIKLGTDPTNRGIILNTKGQMILHGGTSENPASISLDTYGFIKIGASGNVTAQNTSDVTSSTSIFSQMKSDGNIASTTAIFVKKEGTINNSTGAGKNHAVMSIQGSGTIGAPWKGLIESSGDITAAGTVSGSNVTSTNQAHVGSLLSDGDVVASVSGSPPTNGRLIVKGSAYAGVTNISSPTSDEQLINRETLRGYNYATEAYAQQQAGNQSTTTGGFTAYTFPDFILYQKNITVSISNLGYGTAQTFNSITVPSGIQWMANFYGTAFAGVNNIAVCGVFAISVSEVQYWVGNFFKSTVNEGSIDVNGYIKIWGIST